MPTGIHIFVPMPEDVSWSERVKSSNPCASGRRDTGDPADTAPPRRALSDPPERV